MSTKYYLCGESFITCECDDGFGNEIWPPSEVVRFTTDHFFEDFPEYGQHSLEDLTLAEFDDSPA